MHTVMHCTINADKGAVLIKVDFLKITARQLAMNSLGITAFQSHLAKRLTSES
jgi:hypothetical protein